MKKLIFGGFMMLSGILGTGILIAGTMANDMMINGQWSFLWNLSRFGLIPALVIFIVIGVVGLLLGIWGVFEKNK